MALIPKHARFVAEYLKDLNATQAAVRAGYSPKTANQQGPELLVNPGIAAAIAEGTAKQLEQAGIEAVETKRVIGWQVRRDIRKLFDEHGNLRPIHTLTEEEASYIDGIDVVKRNVTSGDGQMDTVLKLKLANRQGYVEMAAKHFGLLEDKVSHSGTIKIIHEMAEAKPQNP